jgi:excisionase family DNA binding protein
MSSVRQPSSVVQQPPEIPARLRLLTVAQVAGALAVCRHTVRRWIARGHFPGALVLPGGDVRIPVTELERFQARQALAFSSPEGPA